LRAVQANTQLMTEILGKTEEKLTNHKLRMLEEMFKSVFDNANDCMAYLDLSGKILDVNRKGLALYGGLKRDIVGKHFVEFWASDSKDKSIAMNILRKTLAGEKLNFTTTIKNKKGKDIEIEMSAFLVKSDGKAFGILVIARDVTERKKAEEERYKMFFENARDITVTFDLKGKLTSINKAVREYGFREDEVVGKNLLRFVSKSYWTRVLKDFATLARGEPVEGQLELITPKGKVIAEYRSNPIKMGEKVIGTQAILRDVTDRKKIEDEIKASEEKYRSLFEEAMDAIFVADVETGIIIDCNRAACELVGREKSELIGKLQRILHPPEDTVGKFSRTFVQHRKEKEGQIIETKVITKKGELKDVAIKASVFKLGNRKLIQGIFRNITKRKKVEEELTHEKDLLQALMNNIPDSIYFKDTASRFTRINRAQAELLGVKEPDEAIGKTDLDFFTKEHAQDAYSDEQKIMKTGQPLIGKIEKSDRPDGYFIWASTTKVPIKNEMGKVIGMVGISRDITERKQMEEALAHERDLLQALMDNIPDRIYFKDANSRFTRINRASAERMGFKDPAEAVGKTDFDFYTPEFARGTYEDEQKVKHGNPLINKIERSTDKTGKIRWSSVTKMPIKDEDGNIVGIVGISRDITAFKQIQEELILERDLLQALMDNIPDLIYYKDPNSKFTRINKAQTAFLGLEDPAEAVGKTDFDFFTPEHSQDAYKDEQEIVKSGESVVNKVEKIRRADGQFHWVTATKVPIKDQNGQVTGLVGISRDITKLVETEEELRRYSTQLEELVEERTRKLKEAQRLATIGETAAMVGHDLRNPLQTVAAIPYMVGQLIQTMPANVKEIIDKNGLPKVMEMLRDQTVYMNKIVSDLQDFARPVNLEPKETNVYGMISEILSTMRIPKNIEVHTEIEQDFLATLDSYSMKRVFTNLILNAMQAMPEGGKLAIKASRNNDVSISVQDTGVGIPEENMSKLFQPLFTTKAKGQGLGLAVCKRIVEAHGGTLNITSEVGCGSTFTVHLPLRQEVKRVE
jgi:PAS domain S-box-containing protein